MGGSRKTDPLLAYDCSLEEGAIEENTQFKYLSSELDPDILSTPFRIETNWHVITGAPCSGKTTIIDQLTKRGYLTVKEGARQVFEEELARGRTLEAIKSDYIPVQYAIFNLQIKIEGQLIPEICAFLDRGIPDSLSFHRVHGLDPNELLPDCFRYRYASVFMLDPLPNLRETKLGPEDEATAVFLDEWHVRDYNALGYQVVRVPELTIEGRVCYILENLSLRGLL
jgi:predicted ATPase